LVKIEPGSAIDLGKALHAAAARRPFELEIIADDGVGIEIDLGGERLDHLAATLPDLAERYERRRQRRAELLGEFAPRHRLGLFIGAELALRDRPGANIL